MRSGLVDHASVRGHSCCLGIGRLPACLTQLIHRALWRSARPKSCLSSARTDILFHSDQCQRGSHVATRLRGRWGLFTMILPRLWQKFYASEAAVLASKSSLRTVAVPGHSKQVGAMVALPENHTRVYSLLDLFCSPNLSHSHSHTHARTRAPKRPFYEWVK